MNKGYIYSLDGDPWAGVRTHTYTTHSHLMGSRYGWCANAHIYNTFTRIQYSNNWDCPFFQYCWNEKLRLPMIDDCRGCRGQLCIRDRSRSPKRQRISTLERLSEPSSSGLATVHKAD